MRKTQLLTRMGVLIALGVVLSYMSAIPLLGAKLYPAQAAINVVAGAMLGPWYAGAVALCIALLRIGLGTGSLLAIPGSIFGAILAGLLYQATRSRLAAMAGELVGTGLLASLAGYPMALYLMGSKAAAVAAAGGTFYLVASFTVSSFSGALIGGAVLAALGKWVAPVPMRSSAR